MPAATQQPKLLDQVRRRFRLLHYSYRTEQTYYWIKRYCFFHNLQHSATLSAESVRTYLSYLANGRDVATATQNVALNALLFLYREVLDTDLDNFSDFVRAKRARRLPVVLSCDEAHRLLNAMRGEARLTAFLLYGSGLRFSEALRLRVKNLDFDYGQIIVRSSKGDKDRRTMLPQALVEALHRQLGPLSLRP